MNQSDNWVIEPEIEPEEINTLDYQVRRRRDEFDEILKEWDVDKLEICGALFDIEDIKKREIEEFSFDDLILWTYAKIKKELMGEDDYLRLNTDRVIFENKRINSTIGIVVLLLADLKVSIEKQTHDRSWRLLTDISHDLGSLEAMKDYEINKENRVRASKKGGETKAVRLSGPLKNELIRLIQDKKPKEGWKNESQVAEQLYIDLQNYAESTDSKILSENMYENIVKWIKNNAAVKSAFEQTKKVTKG